MTVAYVKYMKYFIDNISMNENYIKWLLHEDTKKATLYCVRKWMCAYS